MGQGAHHAPSLPCDELQKVTKGISQILYFSWGKNKSQKLGYIVLETHKNPSKGSGVL